MECTPILGNVSIDATIVSSDPLSHYANFSSPPYSFNFTNLLAPYRAYITAEKVLTMYVIGCICVFGVVGNILNLIILTHRSLTRHMDHMGKSAYISIIALAVSDLLFCLCAFPHTVKDRNSLQSPQVNFWLIYDAYGEGIVNTFLLSSTWLTVAMAISRYLTVYQPFKYHSSNGVLYTKVILISIFITSIIFNIPRYFMKSITHIDCVEGGRSYLLSNGPLRTNLTPELVYMWVYFVTAIAIPLGALVYCNVYLIHAFRVTSKLRKQYSGSSDDMNHATNIVTLTLIVLVVFYVVLIGPAEILNFGRYFMIKSKLPVSVHIKYSLAVSIGNTLQAANFAVNFILYCILNVHFRQVICQMFCLGSAGAHQQRAPVRRHPAGQIAVQNHPHHNHKDEYQLIPLTMKTCDIHTV